jgi:hypothetical protein
MIVAVDASDILSVEREKTVWMCEGHIDTSDAFVGERYVDDDAREVLLSLSGRFAALGRVSKRRGIRGEVGATESRRLLGWAVLRPSHAMGLR